MSCLETSFPINLSSTRSAGVESGDHRYQAAMLTRHLKRVKSGILPNKSENRVYLVFIYVHCGLIYWCGRNSFDILRQGDATFFPNEREHGVFRRSMGNCLGSQCRCAWFEVSLHRPLVVWRQSSARALLKHTLKSVISRYFKVICRPVYASPSGTCPFPFTTNFQFFFS